MKSHPVVIRDINIEVINFGYDHKGNLIRKLTLRLSQEGAEKFRVTNKYIYIEVES